MFFVFKLWTVKSLQLLISSFTGVSEFFSHIQQSACELHLGLTLITRVRVQGLGFGLFFNLIIIGLIELQHTLLVIVQEP